MIRKGSAPQFRGWKCSVPFQIRHWRAARLPPLCGGGGGGGVIRIINLGMGCTMGNNGVMYCCWTEPSGPQTSTLSITTRTSTINTIAVWRITLNKRAELKELSISSLGLYCNNEYDAHCLSCLLDSLSGSWTSRRATESHKTSQYSWIESCAFSGEINTSGSWLVRRTLNINLITYHIFLKSNTTTLDQAPTQQPSTKHHHNNPRPSTNTTTLDKHHHNNPRPSTNTTTLDQAPSPLSTLLGSIISTTVQMRLCCLFTLEIWMMRSDNVKVQFNHSVATMIYQFLRSTILVCLHWPVFLGLLPEIWHQARRLSERWDEGGVIKIGNLACIQTWGWTVKDE